MRLQFINKILSPAVAAIALALTACSPARNEAGSGATEIVGPEYSASKGIFVPEDTRQSLGLEVVAVGEEMLSRSLDLTLQVFEVSGELAHASGTIPVDQAGELAVGEKVEVTAPEAGSLSGRIVGRTGSVTAALGDLEIVVEFAARRGVVTGQFVTAQISRDTSNLVTTVPRSALIHGVDGTFVYTVSGDHFVRTPVVVGALTPLVAEIREGLYSGDEVVAEPVMSLWLTELAAINGGHSCCVVPAKGG